MSAMIRVVILVLTCTVCAVGAASFGHAAHPGIDELLMATPGCAPPCFLDIDPGETFYPDAVKLLQSHPWVGNGVSLTLTLICPFSRDILWRAQAEIRFGDAPFIEPRYVVADYPHARVCSAN
jgi:hypothetical protein